MTANAVVIGPVRLWAVGRLEPCAGKLARTVLRGGWADSGTSLPDGKARTPYEFGVKVSIVTTLKEGLVVGVRLMPGNPYDGHTLHEALEQAAILSDVKPEMAFMDRGYRGVEVEGVQVWR